MISRRGLPLREFFESRLPNCKEMQNSWKVSGEPSIVPAETVAWGIVGAAFDYRVRYLFTITPPERLVAAYGAGQKFAIRYASLTDRLTSFLDQHDPRGVLMPYVLEAELARYCYVLAMYESLFRANVVNSPLYALQDEASADDQLALTPSAAVADLVALCDAAVTTLGHLFSKPMIPNPSFTGSGDVGGADADLIVGNCLIDIKTTKSKRLSRTMAYQLVGYALLDYEDKYRIETLGFYLSRVPVLITWPVDKAIATMSNGLETLSGLRSDLKSLLTQIGRWYE